MRTTAEALASANPRLRAAGGPRPGDVRRHARLQRPAAAAAALWGFRRGSALAVVDDAPGGVPGYGAAIAVHLRRRLHRPVAPDAGVRRGWRHSWPGWGCRMRT